MTNSMPTLKHQDVVLKGIVAAKTREDAEKVLRTAVEYRDWKRDHEDSNS